MAEILGFTLAFLHKSVGYKGTVFVPDGNVSGGSIAARWVQGLADVYSPRAELHGGRSRQAACSRPTAACLGKQG